MIFILKPLREKISLSSAQHSSKIRTTSYIAYIFTRSSRSHTQEPGHHLILLRIGTLFVVLVLHWLVKWYSQVGSVEMKHGNATFWFSTTFHFYVIFSCHKYSMLNSSSVVGRKCAQSWQKICLLYVAIVYHTLLLFYKDGLLLVVMQGKSHACTFCLAKKRLNYIYT